MGRGVTKQTHECLRMKSWVPSIGISSAKPKHARLEARHRVWHDGGEPSSMQASQMRAFWVSGDNALGLEASWRRLCP
jgi:hypothetical protein